MPVKLNLVEAKSILVKSGLPASDWVINAYNGCMFGCMYCYAASMARWKHPHDEWGSYLDVKKNAPELLHVELGKLFNRFKAKNFGSIFLSSVTDPYVGFEAKYRLTRRCLEVLADFEYEGKISIQTKSPLVIRDLDVLKRLKNVTVGFTVTTLDDKVSQFLEVSAPKSSERIKALQKLHDNGVSTYAFIGPILPYFTAIEHKIEELLDKLQEVGVQEVWFEHINLNGFIKSRLYEYLQQEDSQLIPYFDRTLDQTYRDELDQIIHRCMKGRSLKMSCNKVLFHK